MVTELSTFWEGIGRGKCDASFDYVTVTANRLPVSHLWKASLCKFDVGKANIALFMPSLTGIKWTNVMYSTSWML